MNASPIRLALVGAAGSVTEQLQTLQRLREAVVTVTAESMKAALQSDIAFEAAVVSCLKDARLAAESGKHVLITAPIAETVEGAAGMIDYFRQCNVKFGLSGLSRSAPAYQPIIERLATGKLGDSGLLRVHRWRSQPEESLASAFFGDIDLVLHLFNSIPTEVYGIGRRSHGYHHVHLGFAGGGMALLDFAQRLPNGQTYDLLSLIGSKGAAYADDHHNTHLLFANRNLTALFSHSGTGFLFELREFLNDVAHGISPAVNDQAILAAHRVTDAVVRSIKSNDVLHLCGGIYESA